MEARKINDEITVNDGGGLLDNEGLIDTLITDCNDLPRLLMENRNIGFCSRLVEMVQKLDSLKRAIKAEKQAAEDQLDEMIRWNNETAAELFELKTNGNGVEGNGESDGIPV